MSMPSRANMALTSESDEDSDSTEDSVRGDITLENEFKRCGSESDGIIHDEVAEQAIMEGGNESLGIGRGLETSKDPMVTEKIDIEVLTSFLGPTPGEDRPEIADADQAHGMKLIETISNTPEDKPSEGDPQTAISDVLKEFQRRLALRGVVFKIPPPDFHEGFQQVKRDMKPSMEEKILPVPVVTTCVKKTRRSQRGKKRAARQARIEALQGSELPTNHDSKDQFQNSALVGVDIVPGTTFSAAEFLSLGNHTCLDSDPKMEQPSKSRLTSSELAKYARLAPGLPQKPPPSEIPYDWDIPCLKGNNILDVSNTLLSSGLLQPLGGTDFELNLSHRSAPIPITLSANAPIFVSSTSMATCTKTQNQPQTFSLSQPSQSSEAIQIIQTAQEGSHTQSIKWTSGAHEETRKFSNSSKVWGHMQLENCPWMPKNTSDYVAVKSSMLVAETKRMVRRLKAMKEGTKISIPCMAGKKFYDGLSTVCAMKTIWTQWPTDEDYVEWPRGVEYKFEGDDRAKKFGRYLPVPRDNSFEWRLNGQPNVTWKGRGIVPWGERRLRIASELDAIFSSHRWVVDEEYIYGRPFEIDRDKEAEMVGGSLLSAMEEG